jgi:hypothetical protein
MASLNRGPDDGVVVAGAVLRAVLDLARDWPSVDEALDENLIAWSSMGGVTLTLLEPDLRRRTVRALSYACDRAIAGQRSRRSGDDAARGERLVAGAEAIHAFLLGEF